MKTLTEKSHNGSDNHSWLHRKLELSEKELDAIEHLEEIYHSERLTLQLEFNTQKKRFAELLAEEAQVSTEVSLAIKELHITHGRLQKLSIKHYFDMLNLLPPEKQRKLRELATLSLSDPE